MKHILQFCRAPGHKKLLIGEERLCYGNNTNNHKKLLMPQSYRGYPQKAWGGTLAATDKVSQNVTGKNGSILRYFFRIPLQ